MPDLTSDQRKALDELYDFCTYSIRATSFAGVYVDGDRERIPYEGDIYINMLGQLYGVDGDPILACRRSPISSSGRAWRVVRTSLSISSRRSSRRVDETLRSDSSATVVRGVGSA